MRAPAAKLEAASEKLQTWEEAFERQQGEPPSRAVKASSATYSTWMLKREQYREEMALLADDLRARARQEEEQEAAAEVAAAEKDDDAERPAEGSGAVRRLSVTAMGKALGAVRRMSFTAKT